MPMSGRLRRFGSGLFLSVFGRPVAGSLGSFRAVIVPQSSLPQLAMRTVAALFSVSQVPLGSAASEPVSEPPSMIAAIALRRKVIVDPLLAMPLSSGLFRPPRPPLTGAVGEKYGVQRCLTCGSCARTQTRRGVPPTACGWKSSFCPWLSPSQARGLATRHRLLARSKFHCILNALTPLARAVSAIRLRFDSSYPLKHRSNFLPIVRCARPGGRGWVRVKSAIDERTREGGRNGSFRYQQLRSGGARRGCRCRRILRPRHDVLDRTQRSDRLRQRAQVVQPCGDERQQGGDPPAPGNRSRDDARRNRRRATRRARLDARELMRRARPAAPTRQPGGSAARE